MPVLLGGLYVAGGFNGSDNGKDLELSATSSTISRRVGDPATCRRFFREVEAEGLERSIVERADDRGFASGIGTVMRVHKLHAEAERLGCTDDAQGRMRPLDQDVDDAADSLPIGVHSSRREQEISPGKPMLDSRPASERERW